MDKGNSVLEVRLIKLDNIIGDLSSNVTYSSNEMDFCISSFMQNTRNSKVKIEPQTLLPIKKEDDLSLSYSHLNFNKCNKTEGNLIKEGIKEEVNDEISDMQKCDLLELTDGWNEAINNNENNNEIDINHTKEELVLEENIKVKNESIDNKYEYSESIDVKQNIDIKENIIQSLVVTSNGTSTSVYEDGNIHGSRNNVGRETISTSDYSTALKCPKNGKALHKGIKYQSAKCNKGYMQIETLQTHTEFVHNGRRKNECKICKKTYTTARNLKLHISSIHEGIKYKCEVCEKCFTQLQSLQKHIEIVHNRIRKYECKHCNKTFTRVSCLKIHISSIHEGIKYMCEECKKCFTQLYSLQTHIETVHNGIRKYECKICKKTFTIAITLKRHISSIHEGIKYKCEECKKCFMHFYSLQRHIETGHMGIRKYECKNCKKTFTKASNLKIHISSIHEGKLFYLCR